MIIDTTLFTLLMAYLLGCLINALILIAHDRKDDDYTSLSDYLFFMSTSWIFISLIIVWMLNVNCD